MASREPHPLAKFQPVSMYGLEVMSERDERTNERIIR